MDLTSKPLLAGAGGLIIGALIGMGIGSSGGSSDRAEADIQRELTAGIGALSETLKGVDARIVALEGRIDTVEGSVSALGESQTGRLEALSSRLEGVGNEIGGQVSTLSGAMGVALGQRLDALKTDLAGVLDRLQAAASGGSGEAGGDAAGASDAAKPEAEKAEAAPAAGDGTPPKGELILVGSAASFGDALSVFVSAVDAEGGTARVAVNGPSTITLALGAPIEAAGCEVTLTGFGQGGAYIDGACGEAGGAAAPAAAPADDQQGAAAPAEGQAIRIGAAGSFSEGKVRIFVSGVDNEAKTARVALNSLRAAEMKLQDKAEAEGCKVELTGINEDGAVFKVDC